MMISTDFEARKAIIDKLGGNSTTLTSIFQCELVILALYGGDPSDVNNIFEADKKILTQLGGDASGVTSVFEARKAIITQLGGDASQVNSLISASEMELEYASVDDIDYFYLQPAQDVVYDFNNETGVVSSKKDYFEYSFDKRKWTKFADIPVTTTEIRVDELLTQNPTYTGLALSKTAYDTNIVNQGRQIYCYHWKDGSPNSWPGQAATLIGVDDNYAYYYFDLGVTPVNVIWTIVQNNNSSSQTKDIVSIQAGQLVVWNGSNNQGSTDSIENYNTPVELKEYETFTIAANQKVYLRNTSGINGVQNKVTKIMSSVQSVNYNIGGILYTIDDYTGDFSIKSNSQYQYFFYQEKTLINTSDLKLPANTLTQYCYRGMFSGCTALTQAPELPATTLASYCYSNMFNGCTSLTQAPELPAMNLADNCYENMFTRCTSLTQAPELPATTVEDNCYTAMFYNCSSLTQAPELPATTLASYCYSNMFNGCTSLTQAPELPAMNLADNCYENMFRVCTGLTQAPELPANTLANYCYYYMFGGCTSLAQAPELPATTLVSSCYSNMFNGCASLTQAPELPATTILRYSYSNMFYNCSKLSSIKCLAEAMYDEYSVSNWTYGVASSGVFCKAPGVTWPTGTAGIPTNWTTCEMEDTNTLSLAFQTAGTIKIAKVSSSTNFQPNISMSVNSTSNWQTFGSGCSFDTIYSFAKGTVLYFKGNNPDGLNKSNTDYIQFATTGTIAAFGSVMSLIDDGAGTTTTIPNERCFAELFRNTTITRAPELPATTLTRYCYLNMFRSCTSLTVAPHLPAKTLAPNCYQSMFNGCTKLVGVSLPATTLAAACYNQTFVRCTSLTNINLPAVTLVDSCYNQMFQNCSKLSTIICNATDISTSSAINNWTDGVASTGTFYKATGVEWPTGTSGIPSGWTVVEV